MQPTGFEDNTNRVCLLNKALYGPKQSPLPPHPSKKNKPPLLEFTASTIAVEAVS